MFWVLCGPACLVYKQINFDLHRKSVSVSISHGLHQPQRLEYETQTTMVNWWKMGDVTLLRFLIEINIFNVAALH